MSSPSRAPVIGKDPVKDMPYQIVAQGALMGVERRVLIIVQHLPVPFNRRVRLERQPSLLALAGALAGRFGGWYTPGLGRRVPAFSPLGSGRSAPGSPLATRLEFLDVGKSPRALIFREAIPWSA